MNIYPDPVVYTLGWGWGRPFSNAHNPHKKTHTYIVIYSGELQKINTILELSMYKQFKNN
jgi:hypothetical protein